MTYFCLSEKIERTTHFHSVRLNLEELKEYLSYLQVERQTRMNNNRLSSHAGLLSVLYVVCETFCYLSIFSFVSVRCKEESGCMWEILLSSWGWKGPMFLALTLSKSNWRSLWKKSWYGKAVVLFYSSVYIFLGFEFGLCMSKALPEDLKTKLSRDDDWVSSPQEGLSRASADRIAWRHKNMKRCITLSWLSSRKCC